MWAHTALSDWKGVWQMKHSYSFEGRLRSGIWTWAPLATLLPVACWDWALTVFSFCKVKSLPAFLGPRLCRDWLAKKFIGVSMVFLYDGLEKKERNFKLKLGYSCTWWTVERGCVFIAECSICWKFWEPKSWYIFHSGVSHLRLTKLAPLWKIPLGIFCIFHSFHRPRYILYFS